MVDYHNFSTKEMPHATREKLLIGSYWLNRAKCLKCGDIIQSNNLHAFVTCKCGNLSVDGGSWYAKRFVKEENSFEELSELFDDVKLEKE